MARVIMLVLALFVASVSQSYAIGRDLKQFHIESTDFAPQPLWPYCRCKDYFSSSNPYVLTMTNTTFSINGGAPIGEFCFSIQYKGPKQNPSACYTALEARLFKIHFAIQPPCPPAFDVSGRYVTVDGRQTEDWQLINYPQGTLLKVTNLPFSSTSVNAQVCMRAAYPCSAPENFFDAMPAKFALMESSAHECCVRPTTF